MKQVNAFSGIKYAFFLLGFFLMQTLVWAQDSTSTTTTTTTLREETTWYTSPWVWVAGGALFILLLVAILKGSGSRKPSGTSDRVTVSKTVTRDTDAA